MEAGIDVVFDLGPGLPPHCSMSLGVLHFRRPGVQKARLSLLQMRTRWDLFAEKWRWKAGKVGP